MKEKAEENSFAREQKKKNLMQTGQFSNTEAKSLEAKFQKEKGRLYLLLHSSSLQ